MELLRLAALDAEDLTVISAHLQDAILRPEDVAYRPGERRFWLALRRFDWTPGAPPRRRLSGLHFDRVLAARTRGLDRAGDVPLSLLAVTFEPTEAPSGLVTLVFSGSAAIRLEVECVEVRMKDLGPVWEAAARPGHRIEADDAAGAAPGTAA